MRITCWTLLVAAALGGTSASTASAQDLTGYGAIMQGDFSNAERMLTAQRRIHPDRPELMINLAAVYGRAGRTDEARSLYEAVLDRPNLLMDVTPDETAWSHDLANAGLRRIGGGTARFSSR
jgi:Tfp pilus assembly protein PilF